MSNSAGALLESALQEMGSGKLALVLGCLLPVLRDEPQGRNGSELTHTLIVMGKGNLDKEEKRLGFGVVVLLQVGGDSLDLLRVGWWEGRLDQAAASGVGLGEKGTYALGCPGGAGRAYLCPSCRLF